MIYILSGTDTKKKKTYIASLAKNREVSTFSSGDVSKERMLEYATTASLFSQSPLVIIENVLNQNQIAFVSSDLALLAESQTIFIFVEDKLLVADEKKYKKYATTERFEEKAVKQIPKLSPFAIADTFGRKDKIGTWVLYREAVESGMSPEPISGMIFWKIKTMILSNSRTFSVSALKKYSSDLVSLYHKAHRGECDFTIGLEQFILSSLS